MPPCTRCEVGGLDEGQFTAPTVPTLQAPCPFRSIPENYYRGAAYRMLNVCIGIVIAAGVHSSFFLLEACSSSPVCCCQTAALGAGLVWFDSFAPARCQDPTL